MYALCRSLLLCTHSWRAKKKQKTKQQTYLHYSPGKLVSTASVVVYLLVLWSKCSNLKKPWFCALLSVVPSKGYYQNQAIIPTLYLGTYWLIKYDTMCYLDLKCTLIKCTHPHGVCMDVLYFCVCAALAKLMHLLVSWNKYSNLKKPWFCAPAQCGSKIIYKLPGKWPRVNEVILTPTNNRFLAEAIIVIIAKIIWQPSKTHFHT